MQEFEAFCRVATNYGLSIVLCVVLLWNLLKRDKKRDETVELMDKEIKAIQQGDREVMLKAIDSSAKAIDASNVVISKFADAFTHFTDIFKKWQEVWK